MFNDLKILLQADSAVNLH